MVFIRFQYPLQRHFVVLVVAGLVVDITIMQAPIAIHRFMFIPMVLQDLSVGLLQVPNKQWGLSTGQADLTTILPFPMTESFISLCCANSYWTNAGCDVSNTAITLSQAQTDKASTRHYGPLCWIVLGKQTVGKFCKFVGICSSMHISYIIYNN